MSWIWNRFHMIVLCPINCNMDLFKLESLNPNGRENIVHRQPWTYAESLWKDLLTTQPDSRQWKISEQDGHKEKSDQIGVCSQLAHKTSLMAANLEGKHLGALIPDVAQASLLQPHHSLFVVQEEKSLMKAQSVLRTPFHPQTGLCPTCQRRDVLRLTPCVTCVPDRAAALHPVGWGEEGSMGVSTLREKPQSGFGTAQPHARPPELSNPQPTCTLMSRSEHEQHYEQTLVFMAASWALLQDEKYLSNLSPTGAWVRADGGGWN